MRGSYWAEETGSFLITEFIFATFVGINYVQSVRISWSLLLQSSSELVVESYPVYDIRRRKHDAIFVNPTVESSSMLPVTSFSRNIEQKFPVWFDVSNVPNFSVCLVWCLIRPDFSTLVHLRKELLRRTNSSYTSACLTAGFGTVWLITIRCDTQTLC
jgi:hypothetical protein